MTDPLVSAAWLAQRLGDPNLQVVDASWYMPADARDVRAEYEAAHIPGAIFFDIDAISEQATDLPHMLPHPQDFAEMAAPLGLRRDATIVVYDTHGVFSAPRVWWTLRVMGFAKVHVLDGGLNAWMAQGGAVEAGTVSPDPVPLEPMYDPDLICDADDIMHIVSAEGVDLVDARGAARFRGEAAEPRAGLPGGHIPGSRNLPWTELLTADGRMKDPAAIREAFGSAGVDLDKPIVTTCGSGISAAILALGLARLGRMDVAVYDGSWTEWSALPGAPIATGS